ncbi:hypothetical protein CPA58_29685, partial [Klebsiella pneumoniae]
CSTFCCRYSTTGVSPTGRGERSTSGNTVVIMTSNLGSVFNILLQVLDDGRLTDGQGRTVDFR